MRKKLWLVLLFVIIAGSWTPTHAAPTWRVGLQAGHWRSNELPTELARLRGSTGANAGGYSEAQVNLAVAERAATFLRTAGVIVDVLPATVPPSYRADAFISIHADGNTQTRLSGFKIATHWQAWEAATALAAALRTDYGAATGLAWDGDHISSNMRGYYAFSSGRFNHTISSYTPGVILEMGYLTNPSDRRLMTQEVDRVARGIAQGVLRFLRTQPAAGWSAPPPLPSFRLTVTASRANVRSGPGLGYEIVRVLDRNRSTLASEQRGDWFKLVSYRNNNERWVHRETVRVERINDEPQDS